MKHQEYTKEEQELLAKWGLPEDSKYDSGKYRFPSTGKVITRLEKAKIRRDCEEEVEKLSNKLAS